MQIHIGTVPKNRVREVVEYIMNFRKDLFPMIDHTKLPPDLAEFEVCYLEDCQSEFLIATDPGGRIVGTIGMRGYDDRFASLSYNLAATNEVLKLYVEPHLRRQRLGARMVEALKQAARKKAIKTLYLHTHPFLTGAFDFWCRQDFRLVYQEQSAHFETIHMDFDFLEIQK